MSVYLCINFTLSVNTDGVKVCFNNPIIIVKSPYNRLNIDNYYESKLQQADPSSQTLTVVKLSSAPQRIFENNSESRHEHINI